MAGAQVRAEPAAAGPSPASVFAIMERAADWQLAHPSTHEPTDWTQGAGDAGFMALAGISGNPKYRDAMIAVGEGNRWEPGPRVYHADDHCVGQTYAELYLLFRDPRMIGPLRERFDGILEKPSAVTSMDIDQPNEKATENWSWCDALFMGPPSWVRLYAATGDTRYLDFAVKNWWRTTDFLYDAGEHLYFRDSSYFHQHEANGKKIFWGRGNGWVIAGLVRMLQYLPANHPDRARFERLFTDMAAKLLECQQADGLWRASLLDPASYPLRETSGSGFFTYALAWGVNQGLLERSRYEPPVLKAWAALSGCVEPDGMLGHVQPIGADPKAFPEHSTEVYGVGAYLLAGSEVYRLRVLELSGAGENPRGRAEVSVTNPAGFYREEETVEIDPDVLGPSSRIAVMDGVSSRILDSQVYRAGPAQAARKLLFQVDLAPGETRRFTLLNPEALLPAVPKPFVKTFARLVTERFNDVAWESDRIAHRMYHLDLIKAEGTVSSGIDVWTKRTRALVIDEWYKRPNYHQDDGDGLDDYRVSRSRGCGGLGVWSGGKLYVSSNFRSARVVTTGPVRSEFVLDYDAWDANGRKVSESKRISIDAGSNMSRMESAFASDDRSPLQIGVGIALRGGPGTSALEDKGAGWMTYWQAPDRDRGSIGCAVILPAGSIREFVTENGTVAKVPPDKQLAPDPEGLPAVGNRLAITQINVSDPLVYYAGAGWTRSGDFPERGGVDGLCPPFLRATRRADPDLRGALTATLRPSFP
jgi:unsaturated rhamnogalacturonyl hydrolase